MKSAFLTKSIALSLSILLLVVPRATLGPFCSCFEASFACCRVDSAETPPSQCCAGLGGPTAAATCCGQLAPSGKAVPEALAASTVNDSRPHTLSPALQGPDDVSRLRRSSLRVLATPGSIDHGPPLPTYLLFCSLLI